MQREVNMGHLFESGLHLHYSTNDHPPQLHSADDFDCCFTAFLSWRKPVGSRIMRKHWSNLRAQTDDNEKKQTQDNSRLRGSESQLRAAAQRCYPNPEDAEDPMIAPPDYDVRQSGRVLELQNRDLWLRPTEMSWHFHILMTIREEF